MKAFVHVPIDAVDTVIYDPAGRYDADRFDRYAEFSEARNAALSSIEIMLDERDYDGDDHREELELMLGLLDGFETFEALEHCPEYRRFVLRLETAVPVAA